jgi:uncharacterized protein YdhG (YjbR/CyaY superfamily)
MAKQKFESVNDYLEAQPVSRRAVLKAVRSAVRRALPRAEEGIAYDMPTYRIDGQSVLHFAAWRRHYSLYPVTPAVISALGRAASEYEVEKGTIRFGWTEPVPEALIERIARARGAECAGRALSKGASSKARKALPSERAPEKKIEVVPSKSAASKKKARAARPKGRATSRSKARSGA